MALPSAFDLLIVDDGSPDGTAEAVEQLQANYANRLHLLKRTKKEGLIHGSQNWQKILGRVKKSNIAVLGVSGHHFR